MKENTKTTYPESAPWTGQIEHDEQDPKPVEEKMNSVLAGRNLPGEVDTHQKGKRVRIPRSNQK